MKFFKKSFLAITISMIVLICSNTAFAASTNTENSTTSLEYTEDGYIIETVISDIPDNNTLTPTVSTSSTSKTISKSKTTYVKNSSGAVLWYVKVNASFTYDGTTSKCTSCSGSASAPASAWSISSITSSRSGNSATATAIAVYSSATASNSYTKSVTIKCSATGVVS